MNKFLRKYNKWLLAIFGSGLMVIFLMPEVPSLLSSLGSERAVVGTIDGESITRSELINIQNQAQLVDRLGLQLPFIGLVDNWEQWYLLVHEARDAGMIGGQATSSVPFDTALQISRNTGIPPYVVQETYTNYMGISNYLAHLAASSPMSDRRMRQQGRRLFDAADVQMVSLKADAPSKAIDPTDEELQAQLDAYGDVLPGDGEYGFGYRLPDRTTIEWFSLPNSSIRSSIEGSDAVDEIELLKYWRRNEADPGIPAVEAGAEIPEVVRTRLLDELTEKRRQEIKRVLADRLRNPRRGFAESGGFIILPDDWSDQQLSFEDLGDQILKQYSIEVPEFNRTDELIELDELRKIPGIGLANTDKYGQRPLALGELVREAKEFEGSGLYPVQSGIAGPVLEDRQNNLYVFRIIDTDASRPPASVDEARDDLVVDLNRMAHYRELLEETDALRNRARADGLDKLAEARDARVQAASLRQYDPRFAQFFIQNQNAMPKAPAVIPGLGEDEIVVDAVLDNAAKIQQDGSLATLGLEERIDVYPSKDNLALVVVQLNKRTPITLAEFNQMASSGLLGTIIQMDESDGSNPMTEAFTLDSLMERNNYIPASSPSDEDELIEEDSAVEADSGS
ncbi:MAG: hypothetical protein CMJ24_03195 [Phycisphaerae bacterium]|nr:hypothetical protein [Phycisphaerae bacterium]